MKATHLIAASVIALLAIGGTIVSASASNGALPAGKQKIEDNYKKLEQSTKPAKKPNDFSLKPVQHDKLPEGLLKKFAVPFPAEDVTIDSVWQKEIDGKLVQVYAGVQSGDKRQGLVIVRATETDGFTTTEQRFVTAEKQGALRIEDENNQKLSIRSADGTSYEFDVAGKKLNKK